MDTTRVSQLTDEKQAELKETTHFAASSETTCVRSTEYFTMYR